MNPIEELTALGQSIWYDNIQRKLLENGELNLMIQRGDIRGVTSNPTIFYNAIAKSSDYDTALESLAWAGWDAERIFWELAVEDIRDACDLFMPLYVNTGGGDGFVSLEVSPSIAFDTAATITQAEQLWTRITRPNLMVKIPATREGIPAVRKAISAGVNVNVTLIFSLERYDEVMGAYLDGLEDRLAAGLPVDHVASVASFFVSRLDTKVDPQLPEQSILRGRTAIANARLAYEAFSKVFTSRRWDGLKSRGARVQRPLWASTGTKNPAYSDTLYVDNLIGQNTVNTVPPATLDAFRDHGIARKTITNEIAEARSTFSKLEEQGISIKSVTQQLEQEGVKAFADSFHELILAIDEKRKLFLSGIEPLAPCLARRITQLEMDAVPRRLWDKDSDLWAINPNEKDEISVRLGWLDSPQKAHALSPAYLSFAKQIHDEGIDRVLVLGMGGSSLTAEVLSSLLAGANIEAPLSLAVLDSTNPLQVAQAAVDFPPSKSLYIVASKSGGTAEVMAVFDLFWEQSKGDGNRFIAITDPGTDLENLARQRHFRRIFTSDKNVGGRFSALTDFGLVPAALLGMDLNRVLRQVDWMVRQCASHLPVARNAGMVLGAALAEAVFLKRDKMTILADEPLAALAGWVEQIVAESSGKVGKGILPVSLEPLGQSSVYGKDRFFVYLRQTGEFDRHTASLSAAGFPVIQLKITDPYAAVAEFFRWEVATVVACHILGINPFNQPDVQESKVRTKDRITEFLRTNKLTVEDLVEGMEIGPAVLDFIAKANPGDFLSINAYLPRNSATIDVIQNLRVILRERTGCAVTAGFGPRFHHSTGQYHKGGPNTGWFIQLLHDPQQDIKIPGRELTFGAFLTAQANGDYDALKESNRRVLRISIGNDIDQGLNKLIKAIS